MPYGDDNRAADLDLASRDPALPGLRILFVPSAFAAALGRVLPGTIEAVRPAYVRYKPGMNCLVSYRVETDNGTHEVYAKAYRNADREKLQKAVCRGSFSLDQHVVASIFPVDAKLKSLGRLSDERNRTRLLRRLLPECPELWSGDVRELRYKPERRYVARLEVDGRPVAALKFFTSLGYGAASAGARAFRSGASVRVPDRLGRSRKHQVLAYEWLHGALLSDRLTYGGCSADDFRRVGVALAELHGQAAETLPRIGQDLECARLTEVAAAIGLLHPGLAARVDVLAGRLGRSLGGLEPVMSPIHGDFYAKQVLLRADGVGVLDFDESALGDPASDLGNFIAHLERDELRGRIGTAEAQRASDALVEGYARAADVPSMGRVRLYTARCLFALAPHPFRFREANWPAATAKLVERCRELLDAERDPRPVPRRGCGSRRAARRARRIPVEDRFGIRSDPALPFIAGALEADLVEERLRQFCDRLGGAGSVLALRQIRVLRHKPGRRCLIEYELDVARPGHPSGQLALIGKVRARGLDAKTYSLCGRLWRTGFGDASADRISTPEPVGCLPEWNMWLQRRVPGVPSTERLTGNDAAAVVRRIARGLHKLNRDGPPTDRRHTLSDELRILHDRLSIVGRRNPRWTRRLGRVLRLCDRVADSISEPRPQPIHRDLHAGNLLVDGNRTYILDLDLYSMGDPALDAGNFIGHLTELAVRRTGNAHALRSLEQAFEDSYVGFAGESRRPDVRGYAKLTLARHIYISTLFDDRRGTTGPLIDLCEKRLSAGHKTTQLVASGGGR